ncbi:MAG: hypothetical protein WC942_04925 [Clostridia bacterium]|jgi:tRNA(Arg) A34 adenosine deaminase TadA
MVRQSYNGERSGCESQMKHLFREAKRIALKGDRLRKHCLGAIGVRRDGVIVKSSNLPNRLPEIHAHAEARVVRKLGWGGTVYVVRVKRDGTLALARPCKHCQGIMRSNGVRHCYYSISDTEFGVINYV